MGKVHLPMGSTGNQNPHRGVLTPLHPIQNKNIGFSCILISKNAEGKKKSTHTQQTSCPAICIQHVPAIAIQIIMVSVEVMHSTSKDY